VEGAGVHPDIHPRGEGSGTLIFLPKAITIQYFSLTCRQLLFPKTKNLNQIQCAKDVKVQSVSQMEGLLKG
jgi:hypothetical protein